MNPATIRRPLDGNRLVATLILAAVILTGPPRAVSAPAGHDQRELAREVIDLIRQEHRAEALVLCRTYTDRFPDDPAMLYNLACLANTAGRTAEALDAFARAVAAGFDDFEMAFADPDLAELRYHPDMIDMAVEHQADLSRRADEKTVILSWQDPTPPIPLAVAGRDTASGAPEIRLTWTPAGLDVELHAAGPWSALLATDDLAPWNGGPGMVFTLGVPDSSGNYYYHTSNHFLYAFGMEKGTPLGALYLSGQQRWQTLNELVPKIRLDKTGRLELHTIIPWATILPYNPLMDDHLGFNVSLRLTGTAGPLTASLLPDPAAFRPRASKRRIVPLVFRGDSVAEDVLAGKVSDTISQGEPIAFDLAVYCQEAGTGRLTIDFLGGPQQSLLPDGQATSTIPLDRGLNRLTRQADFTALNTGTYVIKTSLTFPSGRTLTWGASVLQLSSNWRDEFLTRIDKLDTNERPTAEYYLDSIDQALASHSTRHSPGAITTTLDELGRLLDNHDRDGSILPDRGSFLAVYPGPDQSTRLCHIYLPAGWKIAARLNPVITLTTSPAMAGAIAGRVGRNYEQGGRLPTIKGGPDEGFPVYLVPSLVPPTDRQPGDPVADPTAETRACLAWARNTFKATTVSVVGFGGEAGTALDLAMDRPRALKAMIIFGDGGLEPWPQADAGFIRRQLADFPPDLPVTWIDFVRETEIVGQGLLILELLKEQGSNIVKVQEVRGGLNFTQVADRTVLWAESLR